MADYWKSTGKWFCDICKCWTADNRASIDFHERGKNHQENKRRRLIEIKKNAMDKRKKDAKDEKMFEKMEKAALAAVQKDMAGSKGGLGKSDMKNIVAAHSSDSSSSTIDTYPWTAMLAPQGFTYYYNSQTGQSTWEMPEVFKKIEEQKQKEKYAVRATKTTTVKSKVIDDNSSNAEETEEKEEEPVEERDVHPLLGGWSTVKSDPVKKKQNDEPTPDETPNETVDAKEVEKPTVAEVPRETGKKFKEKVMKTNLVSSDEPVTFKKRKSALKNVRKRNDDD